jgi:hypothetical protein
MTWIAVLPKHYRAIVLEVLASFPDSTVWVDEHRCQDFSEAGPLTQQGIAGMSNLEISTESIPILGFHDHPREMWIDSRFRDLAERLADLGHLKIQRIGDTRRAPKKPWLKWTIGSLALVGSAYALVNFWAAAELGYDAYPRGKSIIAGWGHAVLGCFVAGILCGIMAVRAARRANA